MYPCWLVDRFWIDPYIVDVGWVATPQRSEALPSYCAVLYVYLYIYIQSLKYFVNLKF